MIDFFELWEQALDKDPFLRLDIGYYKTTDWMIIIDSKSGGVETEVANVQSCSRQEALAMAYVQLAHWLKETHGGY